MRLFYLCTVRFTVLKLLSYSFLCGEINNKIKNMIKFIKKLWYKAQLNDLEFQMMFMEIDFKSYLTEKDYYINKLKSL